MVPLLGTARADDLLGLLDRPETLPQIGALLAAASPG
jgi:hypothetical protein